MTSDNNSKIIKFPGAPKHDFALRFRVDLVLLPQPVWRRFLVPASASFWDLHVAIQDAMGWEDKHIHQFTLDDPKSGERLRFGVPDNSQFHGVNEILPGWEHPVAGYCKPEMPAMLYTYDFGDHWQHEVMMEGIVANSGEADLPVCLAGVGNCPPEDSGGPSAYSPATNTSGDEIVFQPELVVFDDPRQRWERFFGEE